MSFEPTSKNNPSSRPADDADLPSATGCTQKGTLNMLGVLREIRIINTVMGEHEDAARA